uniref:Uncharacterized protein n=1 Tax=Anguilla anguilla TaxID=7936 RepID=A0A0E9UR91_ANGAN
MAVANIKIKTHRIKYQNEKITTAYLQRALFLFILFYYIFNQLIRASGQVYTLNFPLLQVY